MRLLLLAGLVMTAVAGSAAAQPVDGAASSAATPATPVTVKPAVAQPAEKGSAGRRDAATGDPNRRICRTEMATGSRLASAKTCRTAREWEERRQAAKDELDRNQRADGTNGS